MQNLARELLLLKWAKKNPESLGRVAEKLGAKWKPKTYQISFFDNDNTNQKSQVSALPF
jgi:hypothetical protein